MFHRERAHSATVHGTALSWTRISTIALGAALAVGMTVTAARAGGSSRHKIGSGNASTGVDQVRIEFDAKLKPDGSLAAWLRHWNGTQTWSRSTDQMSVATGIDVQGNPVILIAGIITETKNDDQHLGFEQVQILVDRGFHGSPAADLNFGRLLWDPNCIANCNGDPTCIANCQQDGPGVFLTAQDILDFVNSIGGFDEVTGAPFGGPPPAFDSGDIEIN